MDDKNAGCIAAIGVVLLGVLIIVGMLTFPHYNVYSQRLAGEAKLREAESSRQILVQEASAKKEAARLLAEAEIERAKGVAEANRIIGEGLRGHSEYLMYLWIQSLGEKENHVVYVPTEANLPILEASRFQAPIRKQSQKEN